MTLEIPPDRWTRFCQQLSTKQNTLLDIRIESEGDLRTVAQGAPLHSFVFEQGDACNSSLIIEFGPSAAGALRHGVIEPIQFILRKDGNHEHFNLLEIPSESGTTVVTFHPGISPALVAELEAPPAAVSSAPGVA